MFFTYQSVHFHVSLAFLVIKEFKNSINCLLTTRYWFELVVVGVVTGVCFYEGHLLSICLWADNYLRWAHSLSSKKTKGLPGNVEKSDDVLPDCSSDDTCYATLSSLFRFTAAMQT